MKQDNLTLKGKFRYTKYRNGEVVYVSPWIENLILQNDAPCGLYVILNRMLGITTHDIEITSAEIGTGSTAPAITDTSLVAMVLDGIPIATRSRDADDEITFVFFINDKELADGTYNEIGLRAGTQLFARALIDPSFTKSTGEDFRFDYTITASPTIEA